MTNVSVLERELARVRAELDEVKRRLRGTQTVIVSSGGGGGGLPDPPDRTKDWVLFWDHATGAARWIEAGPDCPTP